MESDDDSRSSNSSGSSNSSSNGPASPPQENDNDSNDQSEQPMGIQREQSESQDSSSFQGKLEDSNQGNRSPTPTLDRSNDQEQSKDGEDDEEELELSDIEDETNKRDKKDLSHEDLSDISDLESSNEATPPQYTDLRQKLEKNRQNGSANNIDKKNDEDELDFEDDEVKESADSNVLSRKPHESKDSGNGSAKEDGEAKSDKELESGEELEDGEVTDGDEKRPEESEPKAVCRFFTRGQCTWGMSCRFLHPGTTDKGNYTMFDLVRPIPVPQAGMAIMPSYDYRTERPPIHHPHIPPHPYAPGPVARAPPPAADNESAWERGLRTAKEMMRKANKRKEQDIDFDEKKMNLSGPPDEIERDPYYVRGSPDNTPPFEKIRGPPRGGPPYSPPAKYPRGPYFEEDQYGRMARSYRELPPHRMPHYEDEEIGGKRRPTRPTREVIVEKADDWNDPWMRKSPGRGGSGKGRKGRERSYSSNSSYSSSSSSSRSRSRSSSDSSQSPHQRRYNTKGSRERVTPRKVEKRSRSTSLKRRHSPVRSRVPKKAISPVPKRAKKQLSPPARASRKKRDSSSSSGSESDSSYSSSTSSSKGKRRREKIVSERKPVAVKKVEMTKKRTPPPATVKDDDNISSNKEKGSTEKASAAAKLKSSRREELLKQLKAVEDAIARKRSKIT